MVVGHKIAIAITNSFYAVFCAIAVHVPNFIGIRQKPKRNKKLKRLAIG